MKLALVGLLVASTASAEPAVPPKVVTQAWLREMNDAKWPLEAMVDWHRGVILLERLVDSPREDYEGVVSARKICKPADLRRVRRQIEGMYKSADTFSCQNKPTAECSFDYAYEYTTITNLAFTKADDGTLRLTSVMFIDGGSQGETFREEQAAWISKQLKKLEAVSCDAR